MTWEERRNTHLALAHEHMASAQAALRRFIETHKRNDFDEYEAEFKLHNKHWGIAQAMYTRRYGK